jgi:hypothetical protein
MCFGVLLPLCAFTGRRSRDNGTTQHTTGSLKDNVCIMNEHTRPRFRGRMALRSSRYEVSAIKWSFLFILLAMSSLPCDRSTGTGLSACLWVCPSAFASASSLENEEGDEAAGRSSLRKSRSVIQEEKRPTMNQILIRAGKSGLGGGIPGALAGMVQVITLMWLRTIINYQCRYGTSFSQALVTLTRDGGIPR